MAKKLISALQGKKQRIPPIWLMRQAGRYLPEYMKTRQQAGGFLDLCYNSDLSTEVTLQPIRKFGFDAAILFADILLIPQALGMKLWFEPGEGPRLNSIRDGFKINNLKSIEDIHETLHPIYQTVKNLSETLPHSTTLIGFAGAPWTVATYMINGKGSKDHKESNSFLSEKKADFEILINILTKATIEYLSEQIKAGAEVIKIFDSWAGALTEANIFKYSYLPMIEITKELKKRYADIPVIVFPRGIGKNYTLFANSSQFSGLALDQSLSLEFARKLQDSIVIQGNLNPQLLVTGGAELKAQVNLLIEKLNAKPYIFNLGHGITPDAKVRNVELLIEYIKDR